MGACAGEEKEGGRGEVRNHSSKKNETTSKPSIEKSKTTTKKISRAPQTPSLDTTTLATKTHLGKIHHKGIHVQAVQETRKTLAKAAQTLVHELQVHEIGLQVGHGVGELGKLRLQGVERLVSVAGGLRMVRACGRRAERCARRRSQRCCRARDA